MKRVKRFGVYQTAKVSAIIYFVVTLVVLIVITLLALMVGGTELLGFQMYGGAMLLIAPVLYGIAGFVLTALGCITYNLVSGWTGGIELEFDIDDEDTMSHLVE
ncbi:MAG: hypothetical protein KDC53_01545 [Saprospiraceae bacterium]|nr:hypothetical protein [Saprospiraceae bacterium]